MFESIYKIMIYIKKLKNSECLSIGGTNQEPPVVQLFTINSDFIQNWDIVEYEMINKTVEVWNRNAQG